MNIITDILNTRHSLRKQLFDLNREEDVDVCKIKEIEDLVIGISTFLGEIERVKKVGEVDNSEGIRFVRKYLQEQEQIYIDSMYSDEAREKARRVHNAFLNFLPPQLEAAELREKILEYQSDIQELGKKAIGKINSEFKTKYEGRYDPALLNKLIIDFIG